METSAAIAHVGYLISISLFIIGIKRLSKVRTARGANALAASAMAIAIVSQLIELGVVRYSVMAAGIIAGALIGAALARTVAMTAMPQLVAVFNGFGGAASALVAFALFAAAPRGLNLAQTPIQGESGYPIAITIVLSVIIGCVTLSGSIVAYLKLSEVFGRRFGRAVIMPARHAINLLLLIVAIFFSMIWVAGNQGSADGVIPAAAVAGSALLLGVLLVMPIGGADMPVVISLLNSYSGLAAAATGFVLRAPILIVSGALVGASGLILTKIMCKAMNRSLANVMLGGFSAQDSSQSGDSQYHNVRSTDPEEAALDFEAVQSVIVVPGYGLAVAQAQTALADFAGQLKRRGCKVRYAIHPVAGRMPGHMNVLLAEAKVPYDELFEMDDINDDFSNTDVALVIGANDVVNPAAKDNKSSPLYGMPVLNVDDARMVFVIKRSLASGFAGVKNDLFERDNCRMIYGDAKKVLEELAGQLASAA